MAKTDSQKNPYRGPFKCVMCGRECQFMDAQPFRVVNVRELVYAGNMAMSEKDKYLCGRCMKTISELYGRLH